MPKAFPQETKNLCKEFFMKGFSLAEISEKTKIDLRTLYNWKEKFQWLDNASSDSVEYVLSRRLALLAERESKTSNELRELELLIDKFGDLKVKLAEAICIKYGVNNG